MKRKKIFQKGILIGLVCLALIGCGKEPVMESNSGLDGVPISPELLEESSESGMEKKQSEWKNVAELKKAYEGTWVCGRASMEITFGENDEANVIILWAGSAFERTEWDYACEIRDSAIVDEGKGKKILTVYGSEDAEPVITAEYEDGAAHFEIKENGVLEWNDLKEEAGEGMKFEKIDITN